MARGHDAAWMVPNWFESRYALVEGFLDERVRLAADGAGLKVDLLSVEGRTLHPQVFETTLGLGVVWDRRPQAISIECVVVPYMGRTLATLQDEATGSVRSATLSPLGPSCTFDLPEPPPRGVEPVPEAPAPRKGSRAMTSLVVPMFAALVAGCLVVAGRRRLLR